MCLRVRVYVCVIEWGQMSFSFVSLATFDVQKDAKPPP